MWRPHPLANIRRSSKVNCQQHVLATIQAATLALEHQQRHLAAGGTIEHTPTATFYRNEAGQLHRLEGLPAIEQANGGRTWMVEGVFHREGDQPALIYANGSLEWWYQGHKHRSGRPAVERVDGFCEWWYQGRFLKNSKRSNNQPLDWFQMAVQLLCQA